jgi:hypothetical protein
VADLLDVKQAPAGGEADIPQLGEMRVRNRPGVARLPFSDDLPAEDQRYPVPAAQIVADQLVEEDPPGRRVSRAWVTENSACSAGSSWR